MVGEEPTQITGASWGAEKEKELTEEQKEEVKRMRFIMMAREQFKNPRLTGFQRRQLQQQVQLARKHQFWDT